MEKGHKKEYFDVVYTVHTIKKIGMKIGTLYCSYNIQRV